MPTYWRDAVTSKVTKGANQKNQIVMENICKLREKNESLIFALCIVSLLLLGSIALNIALHKDLKFFESQYYKLTTKASETNESKQIKNVVNTKTINFDSVSLNSNN